MNILNYYRKFIEKSRSFCTGVVRKLQLYFHRFIEKAKSFCTGLIRKLQHCFHRFIEKAKSLCTGLIRKLQLCFHRFIEKSKPLCTGVVRKLQLYYRKFIEKSRTFCTGLIQKIQSLGKSFIQRIYIPSLQGWLVDIFLFTVAAALLMFFFVSRMHKAANEPERVSISISSQCGDLFGRDTVNALIQEFEEQNPDLRIQEITLDAADDAGGADIVFFDDSGFSSLMNASALASLAPYNYTGTQAGQWALPLVSFMDLFIYNIDILQAANLDRPPKTRAEFLAAARAIAESDTVSAFALGLSPADPLALRRDFYPWIWASGLDIQSIDLGDNPALPRPVTDVIALFGQLNHEKLLAPGTFEKTGAQRLQEFAEGKVAMMTASARDIAFLQNSAPGITFGITTLPMTTQGKNRLGLSSLYAGISSDCSLPDEAWKFLAFFAGKRHVLSETLGAVPGSFPDVFAGEYIAEDPLCSKAWDIFEAADIVEYEPNQPFEEEINRLIREKLTEAFKK